jgi:serine/threonine protein phosphatase PrpC
MRIAARTDLGRVRENNEDYIAYDARLGCAVLADGMGGLRAGEVASATAVAVIMEQLIGQAGGTGRGNGTTPTAALLRDALGAANRRVRALAESRRDYAGMGTTVVIGALHDGRFVAAHVGDSRAYRFRGGELARLTDDHSLVQQLVEQGILSPDEARRSPNRNIVTRAVGIEDEVEPDVTEVDARDGDLFLLCSDGLTDMVDDPTIARCCAEFGSDPNQIVDALIEAALAGGGFDNVSVVALAP